MKRITSLLLCVLLSCTALCIPALAGQQAVIAPAYTPSTAEEARAIPLNLHQGFLEEDGTLRDERWVTLYNPYTVEMMLEMTKASTQVGKSDAEWRTVMREYGYQQLQYTEDNTLYSAYTNEDYHYTNLPVEENQVEVRFRAINAIMGIQDVTYNGRTRHAIAITFRGTDFLDAEDVLTDLLMGIMPDFKDGFHLGFSENARDFYMDLSKDVTFIVDGETYTLWDIYDEMKQPDSDFCMLVMGHSLGGSLADVLVGLYLYDHGVHPSNIAGYTIGAAPSACNGYPYPHKNIYNIINEDDLVPSATIKFGEQIGVNLRFYPDAAFREKHYGMFDAPEISPGNALWQAAISAATLFKTHFITESYVPIAKLISDEIAASSAEKPSQYTSFSTSGCNYWGLEDTVISPDTFGDFPKDVHTSSLIFEAGGVMQAAGDVQTARSLHMHHEKDYLLVGGDLIMENGVHSDRPEHLTAGTVELKGDLSTGTYSFWNVPYHATGTHRTVLSGTKEQNIHFYGEQIAVENLYIRNPRVNITGMTYARLAEDAEIVTEDLYIDQLDLNGFRLEQEGKLGVHTLTMEGGGLQVSGDVEIHTVTALDGAISVGGNFETTETLPFANGQMRVEGDCHLPATMIMQDDNDLLQVGGKLSLYGTSTIPDDHLSAGTVELKGDLEFDARGVCPYNGYRETGTHKTILSGEGEQTVWFNRAGAVNRFENLCIRNPQASLYMVTDVRLGEDAAVTVAGDNAERRWQIDGILDPGGHTLTIDARDWALSDRVPVSIQSIRCPQGGKVDITGDLKLFNGTLQGDLTVSGNLTLDGAAAGRLVFAGGRLRVGGDCTLPRSLVMDSADDYLFVGGTLTVQTDGTLTQDHLNAGTVELQGDLLVQESQNQVAYCATGTHRTIFSGTGEQTVEMGGMNDHKRLQACLRNPDTILQNVNTLVLMEGGALNHPEQCRIHGLLDFNGYPLRVNGKFSLLKSTTGGEPVTVAVQETAAGDKAVTISCPDLPKTGTIEEPAAIHVLFIGYDKLYRMAVCETLTFTSETEAQQTVTLEMEKWSDCALISAFWLEKDFAPFCPVMDLGL